MSFALRVYWPQNHFRSPNQQNYFLLGWYEKDIKLTTSSDLNLWNIYVIAILSGDQEINYIFEHLSTFFPRLCIVGHLQFPKTLKNTFSLSSRIDNSNSKWSRFFSSDIKLTFELSEHSHLPQIVDIQLSSLKEASKSMISPHINIILYQPASIDQNPNTHNLLRVVRTQTNTHIHNQSLYSLVLILTLVISCAHLEFFSIHGEKFFVGPLFVVDTEISHSKVFLFVQSNIHNKDFHPHSYKKCHNETFSVSNFF
jgi:hypothetical protein